MKHVATTLFRNPIAPGCYFGTWQGSIVTFDVPSSRIGRHITFKADAFVTIGNQIANVLIEADGTDAVMVTVMTYASTSATPAEETPSEEADTDLSPQPQSTSADGSGGTTTG